MRLATPLLCLAAVLPGAAAPDPAAWLPAESEVELRLPDLARSRERWAATPYPALLATVWGRVTVGEIRLRLEAWAPGSSAALAGLRSAAISVDSGSDAQPRFGIAVLGDPETLHPALLGSFHSLPVEDGEVEIAKGRVTIQGPLVAWRSHSDQTLQPRTAPPIHDPAGDLLATLDPQRQAMAGLGTIRSVISLDPAGLHETTVLAAGPAGAALVAGAVRWADPGELRALPATTLCALTWSADAAATGRALAAATLTAGHPGVAAIERACADLALPGLLETLRAADGPCTAWLGEGAPFPTATIALSLPKDVASRWIAAASARFALAELPDGSRAGFVGLLPVAVGWLSAADRSGRLVITTDPAGLDAWRNRKPGFAGLSAVQAVLDAVPERCLALGAGRGGASWAALAQLAVPLFAGMGNPHVVSLPADLRNAAGRGWLKLTVDRHGALELDAGGLFGGPVAMAGLLSAATPAVLWIQQAQQAAIPAPPPAAAPVF